MSQLSFWVYGFEPFLHYSNNITQQVIKALPTYVNVTAEVLPVRFEPSIFLDRAKILKPDIVLGMGQYPRGAKIRIERKAYNLQYDKSKKNGKPTAILDNAPDTLSPPWIIPTDKNSWRSYDAGRYVCNYSMYQLSTLAYQENFDYAFIHIPKDLSLQLAVSFVKRLLEARGAKAN